MLFFQSLLLCLDHDAHLSKSFFQMSLVKKKAACGGSLPLHLFLFGDSRVLVLGRMHANVFLFYFLKHFCLFQ